MGNAALIAKLGLDASEFKTALSASGEQLEELGEKAKLSAAQIALLERAISMPGGGSAAQIAQLADLRTSLRETQKEIKITAAQLRALNDVDPNRKHGGDGGERMRGMEMGHSVRSVLDMTMMGASPMQALQMETPRIVQAMGGGIGTMIGIGITTAIAESIAKGVEEAEKLKDALQDALTPSTNANLDYAGVDAIKKRIEALDAVIKQSRGMGQSLVQPLSDMGMNLFNGAMNMVPGHVRESTNAEGEREKLTEEAQADKRRLTDDLIAKQTRLNDLTADELKYGKDIMEAARRRLELSEKIGAITSDKNLEGPQKQAATANVQEEYRQKEKIAQREQTSRKQAIESEMAILGIRRQGANVDVQIAAERTRRAKEARDNAPLAGIGREQADEKVAEAEFAEEEARKRAGRQMEELDMQTRIAALRGSSDSVRRETIEEERALIEAHRKDLTRTRDEREQDKVELAKNRQAQDAFDKAQRQKGFGVDETEIKAHEGRGADAQLDAIRSEIELNAKRRAENKQYNSDDASVNAQLDLQLHQLEMQRSDVAFQAELELAAARATTKELALQLAGNKEGAADARIDDEADARIEQLRQEHAPQAQVDEVEKQRGLKHAGVNVDYEGETPMERNANARAELKRTQAMEREMRRITTGSYTGLSKEDLDGNPLLDSLRAKKTPAPQTSAVPYKPPMPPKDLQSSSDNAGKSDVVSADDIGQAVADAMSGGILGDIKGLLSDCLSCPG